MTSHLPPSDPNSDTSGTEFGKMSIGMPRWVKVFAIAGLLVILVLLITLLLGVKHGPGMHGLGASPPSAGAAPIVEGHVLAAR